jgi:hypothetical protein
MDSQVRAGAVDRAVEPRRGLVRLSPEAGATHAINGSAWTSAKWVPHLPDIGSKEARLKEGWGIYLITLHTKTEENLIFATFGEFRHAMKTLRYRMSFLGARRTQPIKLAWQSEKG